MVRRLVKEKRSFDELTLDEWRSHSPLFDADVQDVVTPPRRCEEADAAVHASRCRRGCSGGSAGVGEGGGVIYLVHHADAVGPDVNPQRPLSGSGQLHAETLASAAASRGVKPEMIWHSGKLRARQTAEPFLRLCNPLAGFAAIHGLQPTDPPMWINDLLAGEERDLLLVGHMPNSNACSRCSSQEASEDCLSFPLHGMIALRAAGDRWQEEWRIE